MNRSTPPQMQSTVHMYTFSDVQSGSSRQRAFRVADELRARGLQVVIHTPTVLSMSRTRWPKKLFLIVEVIRSLFSIKKNDVVFLQRTVSNKYFFLIMVYYLFVTRRHMIFDVDDPIYVHSFLKSKTFARLADAVIVTSHAQATWAKQYNTNVHLMHIAVKLAAYEKFTKDYSATPAVCTVGWVGTGPEHLYNLRILADALAHLVQANPGPFKFVLIGSLKNQKVYDLFQSIAGLDVEFIDALDWSNPESVPREMQKFDIAVLPHRNDGEWNKSKSSFKVIEYMACGLATVASAFGEMPYVIKDGEQGFVAGTTEEWVEKLSALINDRELCARLGAAGQTHVREEYCYEALMPRLVDLIKSISPSTIGGYHD